MPRIHVNGSAAAPKTRPKSAASSPNYRETASKFIADHRIAGCRSYNSHETVHIGPSTAGCGNNGLMLGSSKTGTLYNAVFGPPEDDLHSVDAASGDERDVYMSPVP